MGKQENPYIGPYALRYMEGFDKCSPKHRKKEAYCINNFYETPKDIQKEALDAYGPDHPQAQGHFCWPLKR
jgi:hypothetical protein